MRKCLAHQTCLAAEKPYESSLDLSVRLPAHRHDLHDFRLSIDVRRLKVAELQRLSFLVSVGGSKLGTALLRLLSATLPRSLLPPFRACPYVSDVIRGASQTYYQPRETKNRSPLASSYDHPSLHIMVEVDREMANNGEACS